MTIAISGTTGITLAGQFDSASTFGFKSRIINGGMVIDQRNAGAAVTINSTANLQYAVDRFYGYGQTSDGVFTLQQNSSVPSGQGFTYSLKATVTTADASIGATQLYQIGQRIEGYNVADFGLGTASASTFTFSFWVRSSLIGTFGGALQNGGQNRAYPFSYTISAADTWEKKTVTLTGDTSGTWLTTNGTGLELIWGLGVGSTFLGTANAWAGSYLSGVTGQTQVIATNGATFYITGVQLEKGSTATSFDFRSYGTELALCQRYAIGFPFGANQPIVGIGAASLYTDTNTVVCGSNGSNLLNMRTVPTTISTVGTQGTDWAFQTPGVTNLTGFTLTTGNGCFIGTKTTHGVINNAVSLRVLTSSGNIIVSSEL